MISISFAAPTRLLNLNDRMHWARKMKEVRAWREAAYFAAVHAQAHGLCTNLPRSVVALTLPVRSLKVRRDPSNFYPTIKAVIDGLVDAELWRDDTGDYVLTVEPKFRQGGPVTIDITPATELGDPA